MLAAAVVFGWLTAGNDARLEAALILADATTPGCNGPSQVHLTLGNAADKTITKVEGVLSVAASATERPTPIGNFEVPGPIAPRQKLGTCITVDEAALAGRDRTTLLLLARATAVEFGG